MKILCQGSRFHGGQIDRIEDGLTILGHEITHYIDDADLVYCNDPGFFKQAVRDKENGVIKGKLIFNVLDIPVHLPDFNIEELRIRLMAADRVTAISKYTRDMVSKYCGIEPVVIYNPIKPIYRDGSLRQSPFYKIAHVGRRYDPNKFFRIGAEAVDRLGFRKQDFCLIGSEYYGCGTYLGVLNDKDLNTVYNSVDFVLCTSKNEGICLPVVECMATGAIPVVCNHLTTRQELLPSKLFPDYDTTEPDWLSIAMFIQRCYDNPNYMASLKERLFAHYYKDLKDKFSSIGVANAIIEVYNSIK
jgi:hypothetical protein